MGAPLFSRVLFRASRSPAAFCAVSALEDGGPAQGPAIVGGQEETVELLVHVEEELEADALPRERSLTDHEVQAEFGRMNRRLGTSLGRIDAELEAFKENLEALNEQLGMLKLEFPKEAEKERKRQAAAQKKRAKRAEEGDSD